MSEEIKVGDWVATECNLWVLKVSELFEEDGIYFSECSLYGLIGI